MQRENIAHHCSYLIGNDITTRSDFPILRQEMYEEMITDQGREGHTQRRDDIVPFPFLATYAPPLLPAVQPSDTNKNTDQQHLQHPAQNGSHTQTEDDHHNTSNGVYDTPQASPASSFSSLTINPSSSSSSTPPIPSLLSSPLNTHSYLHSTFPVSAGIDHFHTRQLSVHRFLTEYEQPYIPVMIAGLTDHWTARHYTFSSLAASPYADCYFKCGEDDDGYSIKVKLKYFLQYTQQQADDSPLYIFDSAFDEHTHSKRMLQDFTVPPYFTDDLFSIVGEKRRPPYRWFLVGPERSGSSLHIDPLATSAWNTLLYGVKRWVMFPPDTPRHYIKGDHLKQKGEDNEAITYFSCVLPRIKEAERQRVRDGGTLMGIRECMQYAGETIFVPGGWWHAVLNLEDSLAVTQNFCSETNFPHVWRKTRSGRKKLSRRWVEKLQQHETKGHLAALAVLLNEEDQWEWTDVDHHRAKRTATPERESDKHEDESNGVTMIDAMAETGLATLGAALSAAAASVSSILPTNIFKSASFSDKKRGMESDLDAMQDEADNMSADAAVNSDHSHEGMHEHMSMDDGGSDEMSMSVKNDDMHRMKKKKRKNST